MGTTLNRWRAVAFYAAVPLAFAGFITTMTLVGPTPPPIEAEGPAPTPTPTVIVEEVTPPTPAPVAPATGPSREVHVDMPSVPHVRSPFYCSWSFRGGVNCGIRF